MRAITYICALIFCSVSFESLASDGSALQQAKIHHRTGYHYHMAKEYDEALKWYKKGASAGLAKSEYAIARLLATDAQGSKDYTAALPWFIRAAEPRSTPQGYGFEVSQKYAREKLEWICKHGAAEFPAEHPYAKDPKCWHGQGKALMFGWFDTEKDYPAARIWLQKAVKGGHVEAQSTLDKLAVREARELAKPSFKPMDWSKIPFAVFMMLLGLIIFRSLRVRQFIYGILYETSS